MIHPFQPLASCITHTLPDHDGQHLLTIAFTSSIDCSAAMSVDMNDMNVVAAKTFTVAGT